MLKKLSKSNKGFTLIEIVLVLAIAGLLLAIVFIALSGAQKSRRDTQRKNDAARMLAAVESCAGNHGGQYTGAFGSCFTLDPLITATAPATPYFSGTSPSGPYTIGSPATTNTFDVSATPCPGNPSAAASVKIGQESGQDFCVDNH